MVEACVGGHSSVFVRRSHQRLGFEDPVWTTGTIGVSGVNVKVLTDAITQLASALDDEIEARVALEARVVEAAASAAAAQDSVARHCVSPGSAVTASDSSRQVVGTQPGACSLDGNGLNVSLQQLKRDVARMENDLSYARAQQDNRARAWDDKLRLQLDTLRREIESRVDPADLAKQREAILSEAEALMRACIDKEATRFQSCLQSTSSTCEGRDRLLDQRVDGVVEDVRAMTSCIDELVSRAGNSLTLNHLASKNVGEECGATSTHSDRASTASGESVRSNCATDTDDADGRSHLQSGQETRLQSRRNSSTFADIGAGLPDGHDVALGEALSRLTEQCDDVVSSERSLDAGVVAQLAKLFASQDALEALRRDVQSHRSSSQGRPDDVRAELMNRAEPTSAPSPSDSLVLALAHAESELAAVDHSHADAEANSACADAVNFFIGDVSDGADVAAAHDCGSSRHWMEAKIDALRFALLGFTVPHTQEAHASAGTDQFAFERWRGKAQEVEVGGVCATLEHAIATQVFNWQLKLQGELHRDLDDRIRALSSKLWSHVGTRAGDRDPVGNVGSETMTAETGAEAHLGRSDVDAGHGRNNELSPGKAGGAMFDESSAHQGQGVMDAWARENDEWQRPRDVVLNDASHPYLEQDVVASVSQLESRMAALDGIVAGAASCNNASSPLPGPLRDELKALMKRMMRLERSCQGQSSTKEKGSARKDVDVPQTDVDMSAAIIENKVAVPVGRLQQDERLCKLESRLAKIERLGALGAGTRSSEEFLTSLRDELDALLKRFALLERSRGRLSSTNGLNYGEDFANFHKALHGAQKAADMNASRIQDLDATVTALRGRLELIWPVVGMLHSNGATSTMQESADPVFGGSRETPDLLAAPPLEELFATKEAHDTLRRDLQSVSSGMQAMRCRIDDMHEELANALRSKANISDLQAYLHQFSVEMRNSMAQIANDKRRHDETCTEHPALTKVPLLPARCISCDRKVDVVAARPNPWQAGGMPSHALPQRDPGCVIHKPAGPPPGYRQRRETTLPPVSSDS